MHLTNNILLMLLIIFLNGCSNDTPQDMLTEYQTRVENVLETQSTLNDQEQSQHSVPFPQKRERLLKTDELRQGLWEVLDFRQCDMLSIISERNSSLGKVMPASQKMRYELRFISALQNCRTIVAANETPDSTQQAFQARLEEIYQVKLNNLPAEIWNGIYTSAEMSKHFKSGTSPFPLNLSEKKLNHTRVQTALQKLAHLSSLSNSEEITLPDWLDSIEGEYAALHHSELGSQVLATLPLVSSGLNQVASAIETRLKNKVFCFPNHQPKRATVLNNVFRKYYVDQVQPYMSLLEREAKPWLEQHNEILGRLPIPKTMQEYSSKIISMQNPNSLWGQWIVARDRHTKAWQSILGQCNMMPGV